MIFNKNKNYATAIDEFRVHVAILDKKTDFDLLIPDIDNAEYELRRIVDPKVLDRAEREYMDNTDETENDLVKHVQAAVATIAFRDYTVNNDLRHSATGRKASLAANEKQAWEFFIERDNDALNFRIQKALNRLIDHLEKEKIEEWISSKTYSIKHQVLLSDIDLFTRYYPVDNSLALFNQLLPIQMEMQRKKIVPILGPELLRDLLMVNPYASGDGGDDKMLQLYDYAGPALALWTMATGIKRLSVKLLPEGLVQQFRSSVQSRQSSFNVQGREKDLIVAALLRDAEEATAALENQIKMKTAEESGTVVVATSMVADRNVSGNKYFSM